jgi:hypothetical protein
MEVPFDFEFNRSSTLQTHQDMTIFIPTFQAGMTDPGRALRIDSPYPENYIARCQEEL